MGQRLDLQQELEELLGSDKVYFQPPANFLMSYPCIVYKRSNIRSRHGNNKPYVHMKEYTITVMDTDPEATIADKVSKMSTANFERGYPSDGIYHDVFTIYY